MDHVPAKMFSLKAFLLIIAGVFVCVSVTTFYIDAKCASDISRWLPTYPNAEVVSVEHDFFRPLAMGETTMILWSSDDATTIRSWHTDTLLSVENENPNRGMVSVNWRVVPDQENGGSTIRMYSECASR